ncbi:hypothetical protein MycrhDRAFT_1671 [Mycolicibacterium rhodesiae JS60]|nr:hypothetical protein MycrhDRAFT_1671 [Mycolicibacterium rhodesiae JS60]
MTKNSVLDDYIDQRTDVEAVLTWYRGMSSQDATLAMSRFTEDCRYWAVGLQEHGLERYWLTGRDIITDYLAENCTRTEPGKLTYTPLHIGVSGSTVLVECTTDAHFSIGHHYVNRGVYVFDCNDDHEIVEMRPFYDWGPVAAHRAATGWTGAPED